MTLANGQLGMSWLEQWWDEETLRRRNKPQPTPIDGAGWIALVIDLAKEGLVQ